MHLVIEKIPKKIQENKDQLNPMSEQQADEDSQSTDSQDYETDQTLLDSSTLHPSTKNKTRMRIRKSKSERFYIDKQKIIESISPVLLKKVLKNILDFLLNKEEASIIFSNLAPVEARFLENFPGIYKKRQSFEETLTPACNIILNKMCEFFKEFDKQFKLEVYSGNYNAKTTKREVKFMKVPRYTSENTSQPQTNHVAVQKTITENVQKINTPNPNFSESINNNNLKVTISNGNTDSFDRRQNREVKTSNETEDKRGIAKKTDSTEKRETKLSFITEAKYYGIIYNNVDKVKLTTNGKAIDNRLIDKNAYATDNVHTENKDNKAVTLSSSKNNQIIKNGEIACDKHIAKEKELLKKEKDEILKKTVSPVKKQIEQVENAIRDNDKVREGSAQFVDDSRKGKLLQAMSTPLQSYKGSRMMRLMGWEGGALGLRGEGITEPIIPALNIVPGQGLGHVSEKPKPKPVKPEKTDIRVQFLKTILKLIAGDLKTASVNYQGLTLKEERCFQHIIHNLNLRTHIILTAAEDVIVTDIERIMETHADMTLNLVVSHDSKILKVTKLLDRNVETKAEKKRKRKLPKETKEQMSLNDMKILFCHSVLDFMKSENITKEIFFSGNLSQKFFNFIKSVCDCINKRTMVPFALVSKVCMEILENVKDCFLDAQIDFKIKRSVLLSKLYFNKPHINTEVVKCAIIKYTDSNTAEIDNTNDIMSKYIDKKTVKTNNNYKETINQKAEGDNSANKAKSGENTDHQATPSNKIKKNSSGEDSLKDIIYNFNYNAKVNDYLLNDYNEANKRNTKPIEEVARLPSNANDFKRNTFTSDNNFKTIDRDSIQLTINSLTSQNKNWEVLKMKLHNKELHTNDRHNGNLFTDNQYKLDINYNSRKWYERSDYFLKCDDLVKNAPVNNIDHNNKSHRVNDCKSDYRENNCKEIEGKLAYVKINTTTSIAENDIKTETYYKKEGEIELSSHSALNVMQVEGFNSKDVDSIRLRNAISDDNNIDTYKMKHKSDVIFDESQETLKINSIPDLIETNKNNKEDLIRKIKDCVEECKETRVNSYINMIPVKTDHNRDINENDIKNINAPNKLITESSKYCHNIVIIETNSIATAEVHKRVQSVIENMDYDNGFLPLFKYHGVVEKGVVYSCHNKDTCLWLKSVLGEYNVIDYNSSINVHKVKITITSFNCDTRKFFELLEVYNKGLNCCQWKVTSQNYLHYLLIIVVEMDDDSFKYICDNNFTLIVGYGVAQFSIGL